VRNLGERHRGAFRLYGADESADELAVDLADERGAGAKHWHERLSAISRVYAITSAKVSPPPRRTRHVRRGCTPA
jgi:hypothetical protein